MKKSDFYYDLPEELIAQTPLKDRTSSKLLTLNKSTGEMEHKIFKDIVSLLNENDCLVINDTKVIPARLLGFKKSTGAKVEFLLLKRIDDKKWETLVNPGKKVRVGDEVQFGEGVLNAKVLEIVEGGNRIVEFEFVGIFEEILDRLGEMPLPPYITEKLEDKDRYQTVYAKYEGSAAAPTAGLHFTKDILEEIEKKGVFVAKITLHVGLGTFRPVKVDDILDHEMHSEVYEVTEETAQKINEVKKKGGRIICVGTTSIRTIETCAKENGEIVAGKGDTSIFIYPGYKFKAVDCLITNFHLPESTLVMLVSALSKREYVLKAYETAISENYRFFSFGDAMFIF